MKAAQSSYKGFTEEERELIRAKRRQYMREYRKRNAERIRQQNLESDLRKAREMQAAGLLEDQSKRKTAENPARRENQTGGP